LDLRKEVTLMAKKKKSATKAKKTGKKKAKRKACK
jgi:hypothetical protein